MKIEEVIDSTFYGSWCCTQNWRSPASKDAEINRCAKRITEALSRTRNNLDLSSTTKGYVFNWLTIVTLIDDRLATLRKIPIEQLSTILRNEREKLIEHHIEHDIPFWRYAKHNNLAMKLTMSVAMSSDDELNMHYNFFLTIREASKEEYLTFRKRQEENGGQAW